MPIFEMEANGKFFEIEAPDADTAYSAFQSANPAAPKRSTVDPVVDTAKSFGIGAAKSTIGLADLFDLGGRGIHAGVNAASKGLGFGPVAQPGTVAEDFQDRWSPLEGAPEVKGAFPTSSQIQSKIEETTVPFYKPKTYAGEWGETIGGFAPAAIGGVAGLPARIGTQVLAPALASEGLGHLAKGTRLETPARLSGALLAGPAASRALAGRAAPSVEQLKAAYTSTVDNPALRSLPVNTAGLSDRIVTALESKGFDQLNTPTAFKRAAHIDTYQNPTAGDLINVRKKLSADAQASSVSNPSATAASDLAKRKVDEAIDAVSPEFKAANANYAAAKRSDLIQGKVEQAENRAAGANSGQNASNAKRQRIVDILNSEKLSRGWSAGELAQAKKVAHGTKVGNTGRYVGNLLGGGGGMGQFVTAAALGGGGYAAGGEQGLAAGLALALAGKGGKAVEAASINRQLAKLDQLVRSRAPLAATRQPMNISREALIRALLRQSAVTTPAMNANR